MDLISELDGLPLALTTAGAYLNLPSASLEQYLGLYRTSWLELQKRSPNLSSYDLTLYSTWNISLDQLRKQDELAVHLLHLWAYFDNHDLWFDLLVAGREGSPQWFLEMTRDALSFNEIIRPLCNYGLAQPLGFGGGYGMHNCIHAWTLNSLNSHIEPSLCVLAMNCVWNARPEPDAKGYGVSVRRLNPHALASFKLVQGLPFEPQTCIALRGIVGFIACQWGPRQDDWIKEAESVSRLILDGCERCYGPDDSSTRSAMRFLSSIYLRMLRYDEAEIMLQRIQSSLVKMEDSVDWHLFYMFGQVYTAQKAFPDAEKYLIRSLKRIKETRDDLSGNDSDDTASTATVHYSLAILYHDMGEKKQSRVHDATSYTRIRECLGSISLYDDKRNLAVRPPSNVSGPHEIWRS